MLHPEIRGELTLECGDFFAHGELARPQHALNRFDLFVAPRRGCQFIEHISFGGFKTAREIEADNSALRVRDLASRPFHHRAPSNRPWPLFLQGSGSTHVPAADWADRLSPQNPSVPSESWTCSSLRQREPEFPHWHRNLSTRYRQQGDVLCGVPIQ